MGRRTPACLVTGEQRQILYGDYSSPPPQAVNVVAGLSSLDRSLWSWSTIYLVWGATAAKKTTAIHIHHYLSSSLDGLRFIILVS